MRYDTILLDADETLFDFTKAAHAALECACGPFRLPFSEAVFERYQAINDSLWKAFERGETTQERLRVERFEQLCETLGLSRDCAAINALYSRALGDGVFLLPGALALCRTLSVYRPLYIVTNGLLDTQTRRLEKSPLRRYVSGMFISEEVEFQKPQPEFFDAVFKRLGNPDRRRAILLGDSQTSDIQGGKNAGIDTCWFAPEIAVDAVGCTYRISRLMDFVPIVLG